MRLPAPTEISIKRKHGYRPSGLALALSQFARAARVADRVNVEFRIRRPRAHMGQSRTSPWKGTGHEAFEPACPRRLQIESGFCGSTETAAKTVDVCFANRPFGVKQLSDVSTNCKCRCRSRARASRRNRTPRPFHDGARRRGENAKLKKRSGRQADCSIQADMLNSPHRIVKKMDMMPAARREAVESPSIGFASCRVFMRAAGACSTLGAERALGARHRICGA
jgi:hypothetical protein